MTPANITREEEILGQFLEKLPPEVADSFNEAQRLALRTALTPSPKPKQCVDVRKSFSLLGRKYYFVVLFGKDRRTHKRVRIAHLQEQDKGIRRYLSMGLAGSLIAVVGLSTAYLVTSAVGVNLFPQSHADTLLFAPKADANGR